MLAFKGKHEDTGDIGWKLKVATVLEGSVRAACRSWAGDRLNWSWLMAATLSERYD